MRCQIFFTFACVVVASILCTWTLSHFISGAADNFHTAGILRKNGANPVIPSLASVFDDKGLAVYSSHYVNVLQQSREKVVFPPSPTLPPVNVWTSAIAPQFWTLLASGAWEAYTLEVIHYYVDQATTVVDFGTWVGPTLLYEAQLAKRVFGIEASPSAVAEVILNLKLNAHQPWYKRVHVIAGAVLTDSSADMLTMKAARIGDSMSSLVSTLHKPTVSWRVRGKTLPAYFDENFKIVLSEQAEHIFIKVDVESFECKLIPSWKVWLSGLSVKPTIYLSMHAQIDRCTDEELGAIRDIANTYKFVSADFLKGPSSVADSGEFVMSDWKPPIPRRELLSLRRQPPKPASSPPLKQKPEASMPGSGLVISSDSEMGPLASCKSMCRPYVFGVDEVVPIVLLSYERSDTLRASVASLRSLDGPFQVIVLDFGSRDASLTSLLSELESSSVQVIRGRNGTFQENLEQVAKTVSQLGSRILPLKHKFFVVSDHDIALASNPDALTFYASLLNCCSNVTKIGPGLTIGDVPRKYPLRKAMLDCHRHFWMPQQMKAIQWNDVLIHVFAHPIDTTWHMQRAATKWKRLSDGEFSLRTGPPYAARHLDWYLESNKLPRQVSELQIRSNAASHWAVFDKASVKRLETMCERRAKSGIL